jgi:hypothetical protein
MLPVPMPRPTAVWTLALALVLGGGLSLTGGEVEAQTKKAQKGKVKKVWKNGKLVPVEEPKEEPAEDPKAEGKAAKDAKEASKDTKESKVEAAKGSKTEGKSSSGAPDVLETKSAGDGGVKTYKFGPVEVEGRLKSPQVVYFMRRVRAEFAAGALGHRSFMRELSDTRRSPAVK